VCSILCEVLNSDTAVLVGGTPCHIGECVKGRLGAESCALEIILDCAQGVHSEVYVFCNVLEDHVVGSQSLVDSWAVLEILEGLSCWGETHSDGVGNVGGGLLDVGWGGVSFSIGSRVVCESSSVSIAEAALAKDGVARKIHGVN